MGHDCRNLTVTDALVDAAIDAITALRDGRPKTASDAFWTSLCEQIGDGFSNALYDVGATMDRDEFVRRCMVAKVVAS